MSALNVIGGGTPFLLQLRHYETSKHSPHPNHHIKCLVYVYYELIQTLFPSSAETPILLTISVRTEPSTPGEQANPDRPNSYLTQGPLNTNLMIQIHSFFYTKCTSLLICTTSLALNPMVLDASNLWAHLMSLFQWLAWFTLNCVNSF